MTQKMLINARNPVELRVALINDNVLEDFKVDVAERGLTRGNIYFGRIANIQPSLNAAFIDYGAERHGFLPIQDVVPDAYYKKPKGKQRPRIEDVLEKGQPIVVQITREPEGQKGSALTTNLSLAGRYLVLMPFDQSRGISRKVGSDEERKRLHALLEKINMPSDIGVIVRTNALGQTKTALNRDLNSLMRLWKRIGSEARRSKGNRLLYSDQDIVLQALRDYLDTNVEEVIVDDEAAFAKAQEYMKAFMPRSKTRLTMHRDRTPIFAAHRIEDQIEAVFDRTAPLPSGGSIVIDPTEALTAIDVNSGRNTRASSQEETAVQTNLEAAREVARQLRLRDIGGLVVVDFIDMRARKNQAKVEKALKDAMKTDRARVSIGRISSNGLLEINRQRLQQAIQMRTHRACPTCTGTGRIASPELVTLHLIRLIEARASEGFMKGVRIGLHPELSDYIQNEKRKELLRLEDEFDLKIEVIASSKLHRPEQDISWFARDRAEIKRLEEERAEQKRIEEATAVAVASIGGDTADEEDEDEDVDLEDDGDTSDAEEQDGGRRRSRRRRGRGRRGGRSKRRGSSEDAPQKKQAAKSDGGSDDKGKDRQQASGEGGSDRPKRRRRRRSRKRGGSSESGGSAADSASA